MVEQNQFICTVLRIKQSETACATLLYLYILHLQFSHKKKKLVGEYLHHVLPCGTLILSAMDAPDPRMILYPAMLKPPPLEPAAALDPPPLLL